MPFLIPSAAAAAFVAAVPAGGHTFFSIAIAILGIGFLIFVHEWGHFLACRATKTRVETFSIGFGPRLFGWERVGNAGRRTFTVGPRRIRADQDGFDWRISAIPLGGYVKMAGEIGGDGSPGGPVVIRPPQPDEFPQKSFPARAFIICAGVLMNALAAIVFYSIAYAKGIEEMPPVAGPVMPGAAAWSAGIRTGDRLVSYDGSPVRSFEDFFQEVFLTKSGAPVEVVVERRGRKIPLRLAPKYEAQAGLQQAGVARPAEWPVDDGIGPKVVVGAAERVLLDGRVVVGGAAAWGLARDARDLGVTSVRIEFPERPGAPPRDLVLPHPGPDTKTLPTPKLGVALQTRTLVVETVFPGGSAEKAGIRPRDRLVAVDGTDIESERALRWLRRIRQLDVLRDGSALRLEVGVSDPDETAAIVADLLLEPTKTAVVVPDGSMFPDGKSPAADAGIRPWEEIVELGSAKIATREDLLEAVKALPAGPVKAKVRKPGTEEVREVTVTPKQPADAAAFDGVLGESRLVIPYELVSAPGALAAVGMGLDRAGKEVRNIFRMIGRFFGGEINPGKTLGGPGTIVNISSRQANLGLANFLAFLAFISVNLAVLNILPIPVLDGGSLLLQIVVLLRRGKPLKEATVAYVQWAGFALLMLLMVYALKNDVVNLTS